MARNDFMINLKERHVVELGIELAITAFGPEVTKLFFMLNSAEHEICLANKPQITNNCKFFLAKHC